MPTQNVLLLNPLYSVVIVLFSAIKSSHFKEPSFFPAVFAGAQPFMLQAKIQWKSGQSSANKILILSNNFF
jgi:hypothetical protein